MQTIKKALGYVTRMKEGRIQVLVFQHSKPKAGIQIPKGTVEVSESTHDAVIREIKEETGLMNFTVERFIAEDFFEYKEDILHHRFFYQISVPDAPEKWSHHPTGGAEEDGLLFKYFWVFSKNEVELAPGHGDYLGVIFDEGQL